MIRGVEKQKHRLALWKIFFNHRDMGDAVTHIACFCSEGQVEGANERRPEAVEVLEVSDVSDERPAKRQRRV